MLKTGSLLVGGCQREVFLVRVSPVLHPALHAFGDAPGGEFSGDGDVTEICQFIAEGHTIIVKTDYQQHVASE